MIAPHRAAHPACVLINPHAGGGRAARLEQPLRVWLAAHADAVAVHVCADAQAARQCLAGLAPGMRVVLVGGDGTLNQMLPAILAGQHTLGLVPFGSGNDCARALGLYGTAWQTALAHALTGPARAVDVGLAGFADEHGHEHAVPFLSSCTAGFDSSVGLRALLGPRWLRGLPRYLLATLRELSELRNWPIDLQADGQPVHAGAALFASVLNTRTFGSGMPAVPHARIDDAQLDLLVAGRFQRLATLAVLPRLLLGRHLGHPRVHTRAFSNMQLLSGEPIAVATDGEYRGQTRKLCVRVQAGALSVVGAPGAGSPQ